MMRVLSFFLLHAFVVYCIRFSFRFTTADILGNETDLLALLAFKSQITHNPLSSWNVSNHFCEWEGVTCSLKHQRVTVLNLHGRGLVGPLSPHIGNLSFLRTLRLYNNSFHGEIPQEVGRLFRLEEFSASNNSFAGEIPANISLCSNLRGLFLSRNYLVGNIPMELGSLTKLEDLVLQHNELTGRIPPSMGNLTFLGQLAFSYNGLSGSIPSSLDQIKGLWLLSLGINNLSGMFPPSFYNLTSLEYFSMPNNHLTGNLPVEINLMLPKIRRLEIAINNFSGSIPTSLFNSSILEIIDLSSNQFSGKVPVNVGNLKNLQFLGLQDNDFGSGKSGDLDFITHLTNCSDLQGLVIDSNQFGGTLPASVGNLSNNLTELYFSMNKISGNIPTEIENLQNLIALTFGHNFFTGGVPLGFGRLQKIQVLGLQWNQLSGHVPSSIRNMSSLYELNLSNNMFNGTISPVLQNQNLQKLDLSSNSFTASIPKEIGLSSRLLINLSNNSFSGSIPLEVGELKSVEYLDFSENHISGEIPTVLGDCSRLEELHLEGNTFQGPLPHSLTSLKGLHLLDVSRNNLSGKVPKEFAELLFLTSLNLSFNNFEGEVPREGIFQNASAFSVAGNHKICGGSSELGLPRCSIQRSKKQGNHLALKVTFGVLIPLLILGAFLVFYMTKRRKEEPPPAESLDYHWRVSYNDLHKSTNGFSSANLIGKGSYGSVYVGALSEHEGPIAVKVLNLKEHGASKTFLAECEALRVVRHRNLLKILTVCSSVDFQGNEFKAIVFEFMPNGSLESFLHPSSDGQHIPQSLSLHQMVNIATDVASALDYLHNFCEPPIVHCDLKSSNVLLGEDFTAYVGDFGLARFLSDTTSTGVSNKHETSSIAIRGTIGYIPPEYGMGAELSTQWDVYSYGILLLEMFTGKRPTAHMFNDGLSLHEFSKMALTQEVIMSIIDVRILPEKSHEEGADQTKECLKSIIRIGVACSMELVTERMDIKDVIKEMNSIKRNLSSSLEAKKI